MKYFSRKFILALLFALAGCVGFLMSSKLSGGEFVSLALGICGLFGASDAAINFIHRDKPNPDKPE